MIYVAGGAFKAVTVIAAEQYGIHGHVNPERLTGIDNGRVMGSVPSDQPWANVLSGVGQIREARQVKQAIQSGLTE